MLSVSDLDPCYNNIDPDLYFLRVDPDPDQLNYNLSIRKFRLRIKTKILIFKKRLNHRSIYFARKKIFGVLPALYNKPSAHKLIFFLDRIRYKKIQIILFLISNNN